MGVFDRYINVLIKRCKDNPKKFERLVTKLYEWEAVEIDKAEEAQQQ